MTKLELVISSILPLVSLAVALGGAHIVYSRVLPDRRLALNTGLVTILILSGLIAAIISHAGMRLGRPLIDADLSAADALLGIHTERWVSKLAALPTVCGILNFAYLSSFPGVVLLVIGLGAAGREDRAWELAFLFSACIIAASIISVFLPALGSMVYNQVHQLPGLPEGAGSYHLGAVRYFRYGHGKAFDIAQLSGVVTFPSFHMVMALLLPYGLRGSGMFGWTAALWGGLVTVSTVVIGGHYVIDLIGGIALWALFAWMVGPSRLVVDGQGRAQKHNTSRRGGRYGGCAGRSEQLLVSASVKN